MERTLDDSANRRILLPESFLITDELLGVMLGIVTDLQVDEAALARNLEIYGPFAATERVLMALAKAGADRQEMHEHLRKHALAAWEVLQAGGANPLIMQVCQDEVFLRTLDEELLQQLMDASSHIGYAPRRAKELARTIRQVISRNGA